MSSNHKDTGVWTGEDVDYWDKLSPEEKEWMVKFQRERLHGFFKHPKQKRKRPIHNKEMRKTASSERHVRRKDISNHAIRKDLMEIPEESHDPFDALVEAYDESKDLEKFLKELDALFDPKSDT